MKTLRLYTNAIEPSQLGVTCSAKENSTMLYSR